MSQQHFSDNWQQGDLYDQYMGRWSRMMARKFLEWLHMPQGKRWLDVGCGTGALCDAILDVYSPSNVTGIEPSDGFLLSATHNLAGRANVYSGNATDIPLSDASVDVTVSGLVLNFVPDQRAALTEMRRITRSGGTIGAYVWDYTGGMQLIRVFWDAAIELDPSAARLDEGNRFPLCHPEALTKLFIEGGLDQVETTPMEIETRFENFEDYWRPFLAGQGPAPAYVMSLDDAARQRLRNSLRDRLHTESNGSITLTARAWASRGTTPD